MVLLSTRIKIQLRIHIELSFFFAKTVMKVNIVSCVRALDVRSERWFQGFRQHSLVAVYHEVALLIQDALKFY